MMYFLILGKYAMEERKVNNLKLDQSRIWLITKKKQPLSALLQPSNVKNTTEIAEVRTGSLNA